MDILEWFLIALTVVLAVISALDWFQEDRLNPAVLLPLGFCALYGGITSKMWFALGSIGGIRIIIIILLAVPTQRKSFKIWRKK